jgi:hypothetical protein
LVLHGHLFARIEYQLAVRELDGHLFEPGEVLNIQHQHQSFVQA